MYKAIIELGTKNKINKTMLIDLLKRAFPLNSIRYIEKSRKVYMLTNYHIDEEQIEYLLNYHGYQVSLVEAIRVK